MPPVGTQILESLEAACLSIFVFFRMFCFVAPNSPTFENIPRTEPLYDLINRVVQQLLVLNTAIRMAVVRYTTRYLGKQLFEELTGGTRSYFKSQARETLILAPIKLQGQVDSDKGLAGCCVGAVGPGL